MRRSRASGTALAVLRQRQLHNEPLRQLPATGLSRHLRVAVVRILVTVPFMDTGTTARPTFSWPHEYRLAAWGTRLAGTVGLARLPPSLPKALAQAGGIGVIMASIEALNHFMPATVG